MPANHLASATSPYLLQHRDNPVDWWPWGEEAFARARRENRPVFLSIGYSTCHWCHVMAHESFENPGIAAVMNEAFVNIKVDREERPDVDRLYMSFIQATTGSGGWPMSVWLTPEGKPFYGGTYFPPEDRYGRIGFPSLCRQIARLWREEQGRVEAEGNRVMEALAQATASAAGGDDPGAEPLRQARGAFARAHDAVHGGFGGAPKFPRASVFQFLHRSPEAAERAMVHQTLRHMIRGGLHDHLGGGFHRYAVDTFWHVPHFEKMLYDQAQITVALVEAWQQTGDPEFAGAARDTVDYVLRDLTHPGGGFYSAEDADSLRADGHSAEGAFYVWTRAEILSVLGTTEGDAFCRAFGVADGGNAPDGSDPHGEFVGQNILYRRSGDDSPALAAAREKLFAWRENRPRPHRDDKVITAWNGLMISALAVAGGALDEPRYLAAAERAAEFLDRHLCPDGRLHRSWRGELSAVPGFAEDHAFLIQGLLDLYEATLAEGWLLRALELQARQDRAFRDAEHGNYFNSPAGDPLVALRMKEDYDGAEPAANSVSARNLLRLGRMLHDDGFEARGREVLAAGTPLLGQAPTAVPQLLVALDLALSPPEQIVLAGPFADPALQAAASRLRREFAPRRVLVHASSGLAAICPDLAAMAAPDGPPMIYSCENFACRAPEPLSA
jgi:hypothetical protein